MGLVPATRPHQVVACLSVPRKWQTARLTSSSSSGHRAEGFSLEESKDEKPNGDKQQGRDTWTKE